MSGLLHLRRERHEGDGLDISFGVCGIISANVTEDRGLVRCKLCRRRMELPAAVVVTEPRPFEPGPPVPVRELGGAVDVEQRHVRIIERSRAGDDESDRPRWRSLEAAIAKTTAIKAGRSPMRSGWKVEQESRSEGAVRTEHGRDDVIEIDRAFARAFDRSVRIGGAGPTLSAAGASRLLEEVLRHGVTAQQIANDLTTDEHVVTRHEVGLVIRAGKRAMRELLERKGLIERRRRDESEGMGGDEMAGPHGYDLKGWKDILPVIDVSEKLARQLMVRADDPLPVRVWFGSVIAKRADLLDWISRQTSVPRTGT